LTNAIDYDHAVRAYIREVTTSAIQLCHHDAREKRISFEMVKMPYPSPHESDKVANASGSVTWGECKVREIYADEKPTAGIYEVACYRDSHAEGNANRIAAAGEAETGSARADVGGAGRVAGASLVVRGFCCAFRDVSCPPRAFSGDPSPVFLAPIFPSVLRAAFVPLLDVVRALPFQSPAFVAAPPASPC
jgi:hypothetical protein